MLQLFPVLPLTVVLVMVTLSWYRSPRSDGDNILKGGQNIFLWLPLIVFLGLQLVGINLGWTILIFGISLSIGLYLLFRGRSASAIKETAIPPAALVERPTMDKENLQKLQGIFSIDSFYATNISNYQDGALVRGNLRSDPQSAYAKLQDNLHRLFTKSYQLFLVQGADQRPLVVILPERQVMAPPLWQKGLAIGLIAFTAFTVEHLSSQFRLGWWLIFGVLAIIGVRELALRWTAHHYSVQLSLPFALPSWQLGGFGLFSRFLSPLIDRKVLLDLAVAPAIAGGGLSLFFLLTGLVLSRFLNSPIPTIEIPMIEIPSQIFCTSALTGLLAKLILGTKLHISFVNVHPLVIVGWLGLLITSLNLLPAGQLDGGRIIQAMYGKRTANWTTLLTLLGLGLASLIYPIAFYWAIIIFLLVRDTDIPLFNELTETDLDRDAVGMILLFLMALTLLPITTGVAEFLQIGN